MLGENYISIFLSLYIHSKDNVGYIKSYVLYSMSQKKITESSPKQIYKFTLFKAFVSYW